MFGLTFEKLLVIGVIAVFAIGPQRLPQYAAQLARLVRTVRGMADGAKDRLREEMGPDFDDVDWKQLDPRQYDPRRIIREALADDPGRRPESRADEIPDDTPQTLTGADYMPPVYPLVTPAKQAKPSTSTATSPAD